MGKKKCKCVICGRNKPKGLCTLVKLGYVCYNPNCLVKVETNKDKIAKQIKSPCKCCGNPCYGSKCKKCFSSKSNLSRGGKTSLAKWSRYKGRKNKNE